MRPNRLKRHLKQRHPPLF
nr:unnamed protein product [Callosobruchus analis]